MDHIYYKRNGLTPPLLIEVPVQLSSHEFVCKGHRLWPFLRFLYLTWVLFRQCGIKTKTMTYQWKSLFLIVTKHGGVKVNEQHFCWCFSYHSYNMSFSYEHNSIYIKRTVTQSGKPIHLYHPTLRHIHFIRYFQLMSFI